MDLTLRTETFAVDDHSWLASRHGLGEAASVTLDVSAFTPAIHYPNGFFPSGTALAKLTATGKYGPYNVTDEVQTLTQGGSGLTSYTLTYSGQTTASIAQDATAAQVQAALEALSNIAPGDVTVTGEPGGPYTVTFGGTLADTNVAQMTSTPTGGTGTVTVGTATGGGTEGAGGLETFVGFLAFRVKAPAVNTTDVVGAMWDHCKVVNAKLPMPIDANGRADAAGRIIFY
jgi:hypothetical protein